MSMTRQLLLVITLLFVAMFAGTFTISVDNVRHFLNEQLRTHAQDTATSLGLSLSPHLAEGDMVTTARMIDAIYDSGYYHVIRLESVGGEVLIERVNDRQFEDVPGWFVDLVPLQTPLARAVVMDGWKQAGWVSVSSHPGYAYAELWRNTEQMFGLFVAATLLALLLGLLALRYVLRPLRAMERQADAICRQEYVEVTRIPRARELKRAVEAMNRMVAKIRQTFRDHVELADRLRQQAFHDSLTGLGNRRYFDDHLQRLLTTGEGANRGGLMLIELHELGDFNQRHGYEAGDRLLKSAAAILSACGDQHKELLLARIGGADFAVLAPDTTEAELEALAEELSHAMLELHADTDVDDGEAVHIGVAAWSPGDAPETVLSRADVALRQAQSSGARAWQLYREGDGDDRGAIGWQQFLASTLRDENIVLYAQPVMPVMDGDAPLHQEILLRIPSGNGAPLPAGLFMPMAERFGLGRAFDKLVISSLFRYIRAGAAGTYAVNISSGALHDAAFFDWLCREIGADRAFAAQLVFEFPEFAVVSNLDMAREVTARLNALGCRCSIDHFGRGFASFSYLCSLSLHCVKVDGVYTRNIHDDADKHFFMQALTRTLHGIDIRVVAENVEDERERAAMAELGVDAVQGYLLGEPVELIRN